MSTTPPPTDLPNPNAIRDSKKAGWLPERAKPPVPPEDEAGTTLHLGAFTSTPALSISAAKILLNLMAAKRKKAGHKEVHTEITQKMLVYVDNFARFRVVQQVHLLETAFEVYPQLEQFEKGQLANLVPHDVEEAKMLIPSLVDKIGDEDLEELLNEIEVIRTGDT
ncbi:RNA polymerase Rpb4 [Microthyrium microscopicum]|uniref:RNA polymerase Rpb4 n=1 Tax=Microthyrium microscopicum TaxID=703497 RepID=A0A6A6UQV9_9PEZI|nr:RNA polymerase Rpb4 [Microthyrium microscopicum]